MINNNLTLVQWNSLFEICKRHGDRAYVLATQLYNNDINMADIDELCSVINQEFLMKGIKENFEPNGYGIDLELLLDAVNTIRLHKERWKSNLEQATVEAGTIPNPSERSRQDG